MASFFIFVARVIGSALDAGPFAELEAISSDSFARLAERACTKFKRWGVDADEVELFAVTKVGKAPTSAEIESALLLEPLSPFDTLADSGIVSGSCVLARVPPSGGGGAASGGSGSPRERFRALLSASGISIDERIMSTIGRSGFLSSRVSMVSTSDDAIDLYESASMVPRTETRARVLRDLNVVIDGDMAVPGASRALFFHAFENYVPRVLKVPAGGVDAATHECAMWLDVKEHLLDDVFLTPVRLILLSGEATHAVHVVHIRPGVAETTNLAAGILMPAYAGTLARVPSPADARYAARIIGRVEPALRFLHSRGWLHGDVKPSNIFLDYSGDHWLGDYGSSVRLFDIGRSFTGGTPTFQCGDVAAAKEPLRFDLVGLATSVLVMLGLLDVTAAPYDGWPLSALIAAVERVVDARLRTHITALIG